MNELENGMVSGAMPYNQSDSPAKVFKCPWCKRAVDGDEYMVEYSGEWICTDCLKAEVSNMSLVELAEIMQLSARKARLV